MAARLWRMLIVLLMPLALASCVLVPAKFVSTLVINADRSFSFSYLGEVVAIDIGDEMTKGFGTTPSDDATPSTGGESDPKPAMMRIGWQDAAPDKNDEKSAADKKAEAERKNRAIAEALSKEAGYRKITYLGDGKFSIDYAISGTLSHSFLYPYNIDAEILFPFIVVEVRANNTVRLKAPGFANDGKSKSAPGADMAGSLLDGVFTLDTDAEIVSQNNEEGAVSKGGRKIVTWKATPLTKDAPSAVLRLAAVK